MQKTVIKSWQLARFTDEILGNDTEDPQYKIVKEEALIFKPIPQKTKFHLRKFSELLIKELIKIREEAKKVEEDHRKNIEGKEGDELQKIEEEFAKTMKGFDNKEISINHFPFEEEDFKDATTDKMVGGKEYYNVIDALLFKES